MYMNTNTKPLNLDTLTHGDKITWRTWTGEWAVHTVAMVTPYRVVCVDSSQWWEATVHRTLDEAMTGIHRVAA